MNIYELSRYFWDYAFENTGKIKPIHVSIYFFAIEHCNRLGWKKQFGLPTSMVLEAISVKSYSVYKSAFDDLVKFGFMEVIQYSKNQYSSNIVALKENKKANNKALDNSLSKLVSKQRISTVQSNVSIDIQDTILQTNNDTEISPELIRHSHWPKDEQEVIVYFKHKGASDILAMEFFRKYESQNWMVNSNAITKWKFKADEWILNPDKFKTKSNSNELVKCIRQDHMGRTEVELTMAKIEQLRANGTIITIL
jgi:hypothetical protein